MENDILFILSLCNVNIQSLDDLNGVIIPRDILLDKSTYDKTLENITIFKKYFSSSSMTCLHKNAKSQQKWPLLNLIRQLLKASDFDMVPFRKASGYNENKKKIFKRFFKIEKHKNS